MDDVEKPKRITAIKAIRAFCMQCMGEDYNLIKDCEPLPTKESCPLWPFRTGKNPNISEATRTKRRELAKSRNFGSKTCSISPDGS